MSTAAVARRDTPDQLTVFTFLWGAAALGHVLGNTRFSSQPVLLAVVVAAAAAVALPTRTWTLALLGGAEVVSVWSEAPMLGNHWLLCGLLGVALVLALAVGRGPREEVARLLLPTLRVALLTFYGFACFSKLNSGYFHTATSCGGYYLAESAKSLGLGGLHLGSGASAWVGIVGSVAVEATVFTLLLIRRTRVFGVVLGLGFHFVLALDRTHEFFDFSLVVMALFTNFLPAPFATWVLRRLRAMRDRLDPALRAALLMGLAAVTIGPALSALRRGADVPNQLRLWGCDLWLVAGTGWIYVVVAWAWRHRDLARGRVDDRWAPGSLRPPGAVMAIVPLVVLLNGFTPYTELKTAFGWNMYGNLVTVGGDSNHYLIRRTVRLAHDQDHLVHVESSDDPRLQWYADNHYALPVLSLRAYASRHRDASLTFTQDGRRVVLAHLGQRPDLVRPVPTAQAKFQLYRAVDTGSWPRCQDVFGPLH